MRNAWRWFIGGNSRVCSDVRLKMNGLWWCWRGVRRLPREPIASYASPARPNLGSKVIGSVISSINFFNSFSPHAYEGVQIVRLA